MSDGSMDSGIVYSLESLDPQTAAVFKMRASTAATALEFIPTIVDPV
jgi:hypothetical protein